MLPLPLLGMIPRVTASPRLIAELILIIALCIAAGTALVYRSLYQGAKVEAEETLKAAYEEGVRVAAEAAEEAWAARVAQLQRDKERSDRAARDAVARARHAETVLNSMRRDRDAEAMEGGCLGQPLSERTRERLRLVEDDYAGKDRRIRENPGSR